MKAKEYLKKFRRDLNVSWWDDLVKIGSLFHRVGATTEKARSPFVFIRVCWHVYRRTWGTGRADIRDRKLAHTAIQGKGELTVCVNCVDSIEKLWRKKGWEVCSC